MFQETKVEEDEINSFLNFLIQNVPEKKIIDLINPLLLIENVPHEIILKYLLRIYTEFTSFRCWINKLLIDQKGDDYQTFTKILIEGITNNILYKADDEYLYHYTKLRTDEIEKLTEYFNNECKSHIFDENLIYIFYSRCFLSFTKDQNLAKQYIKSDGTEDDYIGVLFKLNNEKNMFSDIISSIDIEFFSAYPKEKEVLFLPYTCFCMRKIYKENLEGKTYIIIELDNVGKYDTKYHFFTFSCIMPSFSISKVNN